MFMQKIEEILNKSADSLILLFILAYALVFSYVCFLKYQSFGYYDWDFASDAVVLWNSVHGRLFYYPFLEQSIFGAHFYLIIILLLPVYAIFQHPFTLLALQSLFLGLAAYPLYLLAKQMLNKTVALAVSVSYLLHPSVGFMNLFETHFEIYEIFFIFFALYYFEKENFKKFLIFILLAIICKENVSLVVFMFGVYSFIRKRPKKWVLFPMILGASWFFLAVGVAIPYFSKDAKLYRDGFMFNVYYQHLGGSIPQMLKTVLLNPAAVVKYASCPAKVSYLAQLFAPAAFLGLFSPSALLIALPVFFQNLLSANPNHTMIYYQYNALIIPFIFFSAAHTFKKLLGCNARYVYKAALLVTFLLAAAASAVKFRAPQFYLPRYAKIFHIDELANEKERLVRMIPGGASVISTFQFLPKLANRRNLYSMHLVSTGFKMYTRVKYEPPPGLEYALIDFNDTFIKETFFPKHIPQPSDNVRSFLEEGGWRPIAAVDEIVLFKNALRGGNNLCQIEREPKIQNVVNANIKNKMVFLGYNIENARLDKNNRILRLSFYWKRIGAIDEQIGLYMHFFGADNKLKFYKFRNIGYRIYPPKGWPEGQIIKENIYMFIPSDVSDGPYNIRLQFAVL